MGFTTQTATVAPAARGEETVAVPGYPELVTVLERIEGSEIIIEFVFTRLSTLPTYPRPKCQ